MQCPKCQNAMEEGFVPDYGFLNEGAASQWIEGQPEKAFFSGIKQKGKKILCIVSQRCTSCGYLEFYAQKEGKPR